MSSGAHATLRALGATVLQRDWLSANHTVFAGDADAPAKLMPLVYQELRRLAGSYLKEERRDHTLQPTALVHEAYLRLVDWQNVTWQNRAHFFGALPYLLLFACPLLHLFHGHGHGHHHGSDQGSSNGQGPGAGPVDPSSR